MKHITRVLTPVPTEARTDRKKVLNVERRYVPSDPAPLCPIGPPLKFGLMRIFPPGGGAYVLMASSGGGGQLTPSSKLGGPPLLPRA